MRPHTWRACRGRRAAVAALLLAAGGCHGGRVDLALDTPDDPALDPLAGADQLTLDAFVGDERVYTSTVAAPSRGGALDFGEVPRGEGLRFELRATAAASRVVGFARSVDPVDVTDDDEVTVTLRLRRPFAYVAGADALVAIDAAREPGLDYVSSIAVGGSVRGVAATSDGAELVVITDTGLRLVSTRTHAALPGEVALPAPADKLAISPDGRHAVVVHTVDPVGISIVDLAALRAGTPAPPAFVALSAPGAVAVGGGLAWVLLDPLTSLFCSGTSSVVAIPLDAPSPSAPVALDARAVHLAVDPDTGAAVVSVACAGAVVVIDAPGATPRTILASSGVSAVTVSDGRAWITGHVDGADAHLTLTDVALAGGVPRRLELPTTEERAVATALEQVGQDGQIRLTADLHTAFAVSVLPDGAHVAILDIAVYGGEPAGDAGGGQPIVPELRMTTYDYQLVRLDTGLGAQRLRLSCEISWMPGALLDDFHCARAPGQDEVAAPFAATELSVLYGSR